MQVGLVIATLPMKVLCPQAGHASWFSYSYITHEDSLCF